MKRWPLHRAYFWQRAPFFRLLMPFIAGIVAYTFLPGPLWAFIAALLLSLSVYGIALWEKKAPVSFAASQLCLFLFAWLLCYNNDVRNREQWYGHKINTADFFVARIAEVPIEKEHSYKLQVNMLAAMEPGRLQRAGGTALVYVLKQQGTMPPRKGDTVLLPNKWRAIKDAGNPFEFKYAAWCAQNNIFHQMLLPPKDIVIYARGNAKDAGFIARSHDWCMQQLALYIKDSTALGLLQAMLVGDKVNLDNETRQAYTQTGIIHIVAISGAHVGIFFLVISGLLWWLRHKKYRWLRYVIALPFVWFFVVVAGAPPSAIRAALMFSLLALGIMLQKNGNSLNTLLATAFILLCAEPMWLYAAGFQLSFVAVLSLIIFYRPVFRLYAPGHWLLTKVWSAVAASLAAELLVAPLVIYYFHLFPLLFPVANLAAALFMTVVMMLGIALIACSFMPSLAGLLGLACTWLVRVFDGIVQLLQSGNPRSFQYLQIDAAELFLLYAVITGVALWLLQQRKDALFTGLAAACALVALLCADEYKALHQRRLLVYNTGKVVHAELLAGKTYQVLCTDPRLRHVDYITKPAHTGWHAWRQSSNGSRPEIISIAGRTVLFYKDTVAHAYSDISADYIVVCRPAQVDAAQLYDSFHPAYIVLPEMGEKLLQHWKLAGSRLPCKLHYLPEAGALVLQ